MEVGMLRGIERLARDMSAKVFRQDVIANNLANATTAGFKSQRSFLTLLREKVAPRATSVEAAAIDTYTSFAQGPIERTQRNLDLAINGPGFFVVETPYGERFTRCGSFTLTEAGLLATNTGDLVMGSGGPIAIDGHDLNITPDGKVVVDGEEVDSIRIACFAEPQSLVREGNLYASPFEPYQDADMAETEVVQGALERSNVNPINEMVEMISLHRGFEAEQRGISLQDETTKQLIDRAGDGPR
jgi:flagellar basal-body rod protein FlgG